MMRRTALRAAPALALALGLAAALAVGPARAYIPDPERIVQAVTETNRASGRTRALKLEVVVRIAEGDPVATGEIVTHPNGLARLELRGAGGLVERQLLAGSERRAARGGVPVDEPRAFLPPLFLLQADDGLALEAALSTFGVDTEAVGLAPCGDRDCYVVGGRVIAGGAPADAEDPRAPALPSLWVDVETHEEVAIVEQDGVRVRLGPPAGFSGGVRMPAWMLVDEPGRPPARLEVRSVTPVNAPAAAFDDDWLLAPSPGP